MCQYGDSGYIINVKNKYLRSLSVRSYHSTAYLRLITSFKKFCFSEMSVFSFSLFVLVITILAPFMFAVINNAKYVYV